jgi:hypothetical protein
MGMEGRHREGLDLPARFEEDWSVVVGDGDAGDERTENGC